MQDQDFLLSLLQGTGAPQSLQFTNPKSSFDLDEKNRIRTNPLTGELIKAKDRRKFGKFLQNPNLTLPGSALNMNMPQRPTSGGLGGLGALINSARLQ